MITIGLCSVLQAYPSENSLICDFCPSDQGFAYSFFQIPPHDGHPCCSAICFPLSGCIRDFHPQEPAHGGHTKTACTHTDTRRFPPALFFLKISGNLQYGLRSFQPYLFYLFVLICFFRKFRLMYDPSAGCICALYYQQ